MSFKRNLDVAGVTAACEYLADQGRIGKASTPVPLTRKSNVEVQELAFFHQGAGKGGAVPFCRGPCSATHHLGDIQPEYFVFNNPESACRTCGGLGVHKLTHPEPLVPDPRRSIAAGCFVREAFRHNHNPDAWDGRLMYSLANTLNFSLETPWQGLSEAVRRAILYRIEPQKIILTSPPAAKIQRDRWEGKEVGFGGIARRIERHYRRYLGPQTPREEIDGQRQTRLCRMESLFSPQARLELP